jgi:hypothetical protein
VLPVDPVATSVGKKPQVLIPDFIRREKVQKKLDANAITSSYITRTYSTAI